MNKHKAAILGIEILYEWENQGTDSKRFSLLSTFSLVRLANKNKLSFTYSKKEKNIDKLTTKVVAK